MLLIWIGGCKDGKERRHGDMEAGRGCPFRA